MLKVLSVDTPLPQVVDHLGLPESLVTQVDNMADYALVGHKRTHKQAAEGTAGQSWCNQQT